MALGITICLPLLEPALNATDAPVTDSIPVVMVAEQVAAKAYAFDLNQVQLLNGPFKHAQELERQFLLKYNIDSLLYSFRREAKLPNPTKGDDRLRWATTGHMMGHYLSACALMFRNTGDMTLKNRADMAVAALAECQAAMKTGFLGGFPERSILHLEKKINDPSVKATVPWYCLHKTYAGLLDMFLLTGNRQALEVLEKAINWAIVNTDQLNEQEMQDMLTTEHGGMNELLANLYAVTGNDRYLKLSLRFNHHQAIDQFACGQDLLDGLHANTAFPKFTGAARQYQLNADKELLKSAITFWHVVVNERSYVTGGNSAYEFFSPKAQLSAHVHGDTSESCNEYNMLKLTRRLFCINPQAEYADYYERTLFNHILSTQHPLTGGQLYFQQLEAGSAKDLKGAPWGVPNNIYSCCQGTGLESHSKNADSIYFHDGGEGLYVNLFVASVLDWKNKGLVLRQETRYPDEGATKLVFACANPTSLAVHIRHPWWATNGFHILINGEEQPVASVPGSYVKLQRSWKTGDMIQVSMPMSLHMEGFKDDPRRRAVMFGPLVMAGETTSGNRFAALVTDDDSQIFGQFKPLEGKSLEFTAPASLFRTSLQSIAAEDVHFKPLFRMVDESKTVYWDQFSTSEFAAIPTAFQDEVNRQQALEAKTVDAVLCFVNGQDFLKTGGGTFQGILLNQKLLPRTIQQLGEDTHDVHVVTGDPYLVGGDGKIPEDMFPNQFRYPGDMPYRTRYISGNTWFSYQMQVISGADQLCLVRLWHPEYDERGKQIKTLGNFEVVVEDQVVGTCNVDALPFNRLVDVAYPIPAELTKDKQKVTITFRSKGIIRGFYEVRVLRGQ